MRPSPLALTSLLMVFGTLFGVFAGCTSSPQLEDGQQIVSFQCMATDNNWYAVKMVDQRLSLLLHPPSESFEDFRLRELDGEADSPEVHILSKKGKLVLAFQKQPCGPKGKKTPYSCTFLSGPRQFVGCGDIQLAPSKTE